jgi:hypothetical protein
LSQKDKSAQNEIVEVNSAIAIALNGLGMIDPAIDFSGAAKRVVKANPVGDVFAKINVKAKIADAKTAFKDYGAKIKSKVSTPKRARGGMQKASPFAAAIEKIKDVLGLNKSKGKGKVRVAFDSDARVQGDYAGGIEEEGAQGPSPYDSWVIRLAIFCFSILFIYAGIAGYTTNQLETKIKEADKSIKKVESEIVKANQDAEYIRTKATEYSTKITKLEEVMEVIATEKRKSNFDIPNFMSQLMFIIPQGVSITNININDMGEVEIYAVSTQYAQLGYFVSRLKLENVLLDVDMEVLEMEADIKIKVGGMLP